MRRPVNLNLRTTAFAGLMGLAILSLACHLLHLLWQDWAIHFNDSRSYLAPAYTLLEHGKVGNTHRTIGYIFFLAVTGATKSIHWALIAQHLLGWLADAVLSLVLWRQWRDRRFGPVVALFCGWLLFFHTETFFYSHAVLSEAPTVALIKLAIAAAVDGGRKGRSLSTMLVLFALGTLFRTPLLFCLLATVPALVILARWKQAALAAALGGLVWGMNVALATKLFPPGLSAAAAILPLLNVEGAPNPAFASAVAPRVRELQSTAPPDHDSEHHFNVTWRDLRLTGADYFLGRVPSPDREAAREWGRLALHTYFTRPLELTWFHLRRISIGLIFDAMAFQRFAHWPVEDAKWDSCGSWEALQRARSYYRKTDFGCRGPDHDGARLRNLFRALSLFSLPMDAGRWAYAVLLVAGLYGTLLSAIGRAENARLTMVVLLCAAGGYALAISGFNVPSVRYSVPLQPFVVVLGGYGLVLAASGRAPASVPIPSPLGAAACP